MTKGNYPEPKRISLIPAGNWVVHDINRDALTPVPLIFRPVIMAHKGDAVLSDSRTGRRFPLSLPITIREGESADQTSGRTQNVSAAGVYIHANAELEVGSHIEFEITLPSDIIGGTHDVRVRCQGRVVRKENPGESRSPNGGVACVIDNYKFVRGA
jgi:PilZ domain